MSASQRNDAVATNRAGFTLIEMMVVVAIIAILIAIIMPSLGVMRTQMRRSASMAMLNTVAVAIDAYKSDHNTIPESRLPGTTTYDLNNGNGKWYGAQLLAEALTGYLGKGLSGTTPDGTDGQGFRLIARGKVYGPYVPLDKMKMDNYPASPAKNYSPRPVFLDSFGNPVLYYRYDPNHQVAGYPAGGFDPNDNDTTGPKTAAMADINEYAARVMDKSSNPTKLEFYRTDYLLVTPGPDMKWRSWPTGSWKSLGDDTGGDDCVNFAPEGGSK